MPRSYDDQLKASGSSATWDLLYSLIRRVERGQGPPPGLSDMAAAGWNRLVELAAGSRDRGAREVLNRYASKFGKRPRLRLPGGELYRAPRIQALRPQVRRTRRPAGR